jgi:predicted alpha/beta-hydrolase family hydrolase
MLLRREPMSETAQSWTIEVGARGAVSAALDPAAAQPSRGVFVCAHGAGGNMHDRGVLAVSAEMRRRGLDVVRFNLLYREKGSNRPDPMPVCMEATAAVVARVREELDPGLLLIGGRSMGGRAASMLAADGFDADGLLLLAYPLHPAGQPEKLRDAHLPQIRMPVLCFNGTRDDLCRPELMQRALQTVTADWTMHWLEGADHSFHVLKSSGRNDAAVMAEVGEATEAWLGKISAGQVANSGPASPSVRD